MKCNCGPKTYAEKPKFEMRREKNQDNGDIIEKESPDQADRCAILALVARQRASDSQGKEGDSTHAAQDKAGRHGQPLPDQDGYRC